MTKDTAIDLLRLDSFDTIQEHQAQIVKLLRSAEALQKDYKDAETVKGKRFAQFFYFKTLEQIDARLTLIDR